tara:strand:+ start:166 stop:405 length:240 start_codon:yes stop_codon:yes gene_type:complete
MKWETVNIEFETPSQVIKWIKQNLKVKKEGFECQLTHDGKIRRLEIGKELTNADLKKLTDKFPELIDKQCDKFTYEKAL